MIRLTDRTWSIIGTLSWVAAIIIIGLLIAAYAKVHSELEEYRELSAEAGSQLDAYDSAGRAMRQHIIQQNNQLRQRKSTTTEICGRNARSQNAALQTICSNVNFLAADDPYLDFLIAQHGAVTARGRGNFEDSVKKYELALVELEKASDLFTGIESEYRLQEMTLKEGIAFAHLRSGQLEQARSTLDEAFDLENTNSRTVSSFLLSTDLKLRCQNGLSAGDAAELYRQYDQRLVKARADEDVRLARNPLTTELQRNFWTEFREDDLKYFRNDKELKLLCGLD